ncbi:calcium-translocating P-type ATPase, PMCA-type [Candidatus Woesearchaeota archaeon]|nr:calcium-translocating P-type ATPase, PMCA-type [Candidatus Woesearchaeota archaeon]
MHHKPIEQVLRELKTSEKGLSQKEAEERLKQYGLNEIKEGKKVSPWEIFLNQFKSIVIWILIFATIVSGFLKEYIDAIVILIIVILISVLGFFLEYRAEKAIEALKKLTSLKATVIRDGKKQEIDAKEIVPSDIIVLETGDKVPADARLMEVFNLQTQEAALTGESQPVKKNTDVLPEKTPIADMKNAVFSGTIVVSGRAKAVVTATGMQTEIGKIAAMIEEVKPEPTPLQRKMDSLGSLIGKVVIAIAVVIFIVAAIFQKKSVLDNFIVAVAVAVAAIPEALLAIVTMALAIGTQRMLKRNALIRRLPSVETLGSTTVICSDKTGTLTANEMTVKKLFVNGKIIEVTGVGYETKGQFLYKNKPVDVEEVELLLRIGALNNNADLKNDNLIGDPTEGSLIVSAAKAGMIKEELELEYPRIDEIEFTSERKMMTTIHKHHGENLSYVKGAPEVVLKLCNYICINGKAKKLAEEMKKEILEVNKEFADDALRVLGFACKTIVTDKEPEKNLIFVGLQGMIDPPREEVKVAIEKCKKAGIKVIMITGDHEITAKAVAKEIGLSGKVITGHQLDEIKNLEDWVEEVAIFARVNPQHKIKIVDALKKKGHVVAMTGDGVNDAPALKKADIGIAMGVTGTDVSKEASSMILTDDNFASIVNAVEEGRGVYDNIRKYIGFLLSGNISEVLIIFFGIILGLPLPLTATQILLINLVTDGLPALALSADPYEPNAMSRKPRALNEPIFKGLNPFLVYYPVVMTIMALSIFSWFYFVKENLLQAQTATFLTISMFELYQALASRSTIYPAFKVGIFKNKLLILAVLSSFIVIITSIFVPSYGRFLDMVPLGFAEFMFIILISSIGAIIIEVSKYIKTKNEVIEINI